MLEKAMAPHSSTLAWKIPCREEPGRCWEPAWRIPPMANVMRKRPDGQRRDQASRGPPFSSIYPKTRICFFMTFTNSSDINRGLSRPPFSGKS